MTNSIISDIRHIFRSGNYLLQIIVANVALFVILNIALALTPGSVSSTIIRFFALSADMSTYFWRFWTFFTYMFTHLGLWHIFFNMMWLYWMGRILVDLYGQKRVLELYIYGGLAGGIIYILSSYLLPSVSLNSYLIGASAGVMAVMIAIGVLQPNYQLRLPLFGWVSLKYIVLVGFLTSSVVDLNLNTGGKLAHFGGAIYGGLFAYYLPKGVDINKEVSQFFISIMELVRRKPKLKVVHKNTEYSRSKTENTPSQEEIDMILDKISKSGYDSLTKKEKETLFNFGRK